MKDLGKYYSNLSFKIGVHAKDIIILQRIHKFFGVGKIYVHEDSMVSYNYYLLKI